MRARAWAGWLRVFVAGALLALPGALADMAFVPVGNPGNTGDTRLMNDGVTTGLGGVAYEYAIGKYEVTAGQYTAFLNAVAKADPNNLYNTSMGTHAEGSKVERTGVAGSYSYSVAIDYAARPVNYVSWYDAARYANWLSTGDPEKGAYVFSGATALLGVLDRQTAGHTLGKSDVYFIPTQDEWYKAAYYNPMLNAGAGGYYLYPNGSNTTPTAETPPGGANSANYNSILGAPYYRTVFGAYADSSSPYGTFDQGGNIAEWTETYLTVNSVITRGGRYNFAEHGMRASWISDTRGPTYEAGTYGIRVALLSFPVPEPGSALLLGLAGLALAVRRRHGDRCPRTGRHEVMKSGVNRDNAVTSNQ